MANRTNPENPESPPQGGRQGGPGREARITPEERAQLDAIEATVEQLNGQLQALGEGTELDRAQASLEKVVRMAERHLKR